MASLSIPLPSEAFATGAESVSKFMDNFMAPIQEAQAETTLQKLANDPDYVGKPVSVIEQQAGQQLLKAGNSKMGLSLLNQATLSQDREMRAAENQAKAEEKQLDNARSALQGIMALPKEEQAAAAIDMINNKMKDVPEAQRAVMDRLKMTLMQDPTRAPEILKAMDKSLTSKSAMIAEQNLAFKAVEYSRQVERDKEVARHHRVVEAQGQQKIDRKDMTYPDITGGETTTVPSGAKIGGTTGIGSDLSEGIQKKITSGIRTNDKLYQESVDAGRPGKTAEGRPIAKPGTSKHETGDALDISPKALTKEDRKELAEKGYYQPLGTDSVHWEKLPGAKAATPAATTKAEGPTVRGEEILKDTGKVNQIVNYVNKDVKTSTQRVDTGTVKSTLREIRPDDWAALDTPQAIKTVSGGLDAARQAKKISNFVKDNNVSTGAVGELVKKLDKYNPLATPEEAMKNLGEKEQILGKLVLDFANAYARSERGGATPMATVAELKAAINTFGTGAMSPASTISAFNYIAENKLNKLAETYFGGDRNAILMPKQTEAAMPSTVTVTGGQTYTRPKGMSDAAWNAYVQKYGVKQ